MDFIDKLKLYNFHIFEYYPNNSIESFLAKSAGGNDKLGDPHLKD